MKAKVLEIRDRATCIPIVAYLSTEIESSRETALFRRAGFYGKEPSVFVQRLIDGVGNYDPFNWGDRRTMFEAHMELKRNWNKYKSGDILDIPMILGESTEPMGTDAPVTHIEDPFDIFNDE